MNSGQSLRHPASLPIAMGAHQSCTSPMASQQPMAPETLHGHQAIGKLQPLSHMAPQVWQRRPGTLQDLNTVDPELTPTGLSGQTFRRSRQQRMKSRPWTPQSPYSTDTPSLQQRCRAVSQLQLCASLGPVGLDPIHLQKAGTARREMAYIGEQATADRHYRRRRLDQTRWIGSARRRCPPQHPPKHKEPQKTEGNGISRTM